MQRRRAARRPGPLPLALNLGTPKAANAEPVKLHGRLVQYNSKMAKNQIECRPIFAACTTGHDW